jgi:preprotein translocase subunit SecE
VVTGQTPGLPQGIEHGTHGRHRRSHAASPDQPREVSMFKIYKPGQGYWTRVVTAIGAGTLVLAGVAWLWEKLSVVQDNTIYYQAGMAVGVIGFFGALGFWLLNKPRIADFMIATEAEMKKVNWPTRREILGSTWVVICGTFMIAALLFVVDLGFGALFLKLGVLE